MKQIKNKKGGSEMIKLFSKDKRSEYDKYVDEYVEIHLKKLNNLLVLLNTLDVEDDDYGYTMMYIEMLEENIKEHVKEQKLRISKPKRNFILTPELATLLATVIGSATTVLATSMVINNERDGNMLPQWSRTLVDRGLKK